MILKPIFSIAALSVIIGTVCAIVPEIQANWQAQDKNRERIAYERERIINGAKLQAEYAYEDLKAARRNGERFGEEDYKMKMEIIEKSAIKDLNNLK